MAEHSEDPGTIGYLKFCADIIRWPTVIITRLICKYFLWQMICYIYEQVIPIHSYYEMCDKNFATIDYRNYSIMIQ